MAKQAEKNIADKTVVRFGIITVSDSCYSENKVDLSGNKLVDLVSNSNKFEAKIVARLILADETVQLESSLINLSKNNIDIIITTGGTGFSKRDITPEATKAVVEKEANGLATALINRSLQATPFAALSRLTAGIRKKSLIVNFPGSPKAVQECWQVLEPLVRHIVDLLRENTNCSKSLHQNMQTKISSGCNCSDKPLENGSSSIKSNPRHSPYPMINVDEAFDIIMNSSESMSQKTETLDILEASGFILAHDIISKENHPSFNASIKDGYAISSSEGNNDRFVMESTLHDSSLVSEIKNSCAWINTGAPIPTHFDAVVQVEDTELIFKQGEKEKKISIKVCPVSGQDIRPIGSDIKQDELVMTKFSLICSTEIGILATLGVSKVVVFQKPKISILSSGDELVPFDANELTLSFGKVRDSNGVQLAALFKQHGFPIESVQHAPDEKSKLKTGLCALMGQSDVIVTTGGVSMGQKDFLKVVLLEMGFKIHFGRVNMKPGKPTTFASGQLNGKEKLVFALPGNPVSAWVTAQLFVLPVLKKLAGDLNFGHTILRVQVELNRNMQLDSRPEYLRAYLKPENPPPNIPKAVVMEANQISSRLMSNRNANLLLKLSCALDEKQTLQNGDLVDAVVIGKI